MCMIDARYPNFQCANGVIIDSRQLCDNKYDCLDGADELEIHCQYTENWVPKSPVTCEEPKVNGLRFKGFTNLYSYEENNKTHYFVYANGAVEFKCDDPNKTLKGIKWNVCTIDGNGRWLHELPKCENATRPNTTPKTNGALGCQIDTYDDNSDNLRILGCQDGGRNCTRSLQPPINNIRVKFECSNNYVLFPEIIRDRTFECRNNTWDYFSNYSNPSCRKMCSTKELFCEDTMIPMCHSKDQSYMNCESKNGWLPGTTVTFYCLSGYRSNDQKLSSECLNDGTWKTTGDRRNYCSAYCGHVEGRAYLATRVNSFMRASWSVAIYYKSISELEYICGGALIRHNLALTAAHCVNDVVNNETHNFYVVPVTNTTRFVRRGDRGAWLVKAIIINP
ncbi:modular serine protease-like [Drosophila sulfurigaster albostrigata]|uniref:modular serine protease-like n=1 Tax=Drosophila sulfurigaster albostrigata TaxID=89887 RepID=UPI002D21D47D|nr:modular serine protease-like [Drosophila sulfurigaster albostrigata]